MTTTLYFSIVIIFGCICLMIGLGFLGAALDRNRKGMEDAEANRRVLDKVRAGHH